MAAAARAAREHTSASGKHGDLRQGRGQRLDQLERNPEMVGAADPAAHRRTLYSHTTPALDTGDSYRSGRYLTGLPGLRTKFPGTGTLFVRTRWQPARLRDVQSAQSLRRLYQYCPHHDYCLDAAGTWREGALSGRPGNTLSGGG